jgi:hypothetical protein
MCYENGVIDCILPSTLQFTDGSKWEKGEDPSVNIKPVSLKSDKNNFSSLQKWQRNSPVTSAINIFTIVNQ